MQCYFGAIEEGIMNLSEIGTIVQTEWINTLELRPDMNLEMGEFVVMPNHFHAIIIIGDNKHNTTNKDETPNTFGKQSANLAAIVRGFKSAVTRQTRMFNPDFEWQSLYHDHIIRNATSFETINKYITNNPENWKEDRFFK